MLFVKFIIINLLTIMAIINAVQYTVIFFLKKAL
ncbi:uncharacterized protein METZ01_LOCUS119472 [marine metagenome]|uniref:Uncharacterized protein n=1 Tax=marine metagenome TaxID=408172 RepID=A0A381XPJ4_9ZZZZ